MTSVEVERSEDYEVKEKQRLSLDLNRLKLYCFVKHLHASLFYKVAILRKKLSVFKLLVKNGVHKLIEFYVDTV